MKNPKELLHKMFIGAACRCEKCLLSKSRQNIVTYDGDINAPLMLVGEAPGADEDESGTPFVGPAGKQLDKILEHYKLRRDKDVYICNTVMCRPPDNRNPLFEEELMACNNRLMCQIYLVRPLLIVALGKQALQGLLCKEIDGKLQPWIDKGMSNDISIRFDDLKIPLMVTFHPAYLMRQPSQKTQAAEHWNAITSRLADLIC
jgi:DNA polymerase